MLIAGGVGKGGDFDALARAVHHRLRCAVLIGEDAPRIASALDGLAPVRQASDMEDAVRQAAEEAQPGDTVLLAPACASFDQYPNYMARGDDFRMPVFDVEKTRAVGADPHYPATIFVDGVYGQAVG